MTATYDGTIAELQRTIADLQRERDTALARHDSAYDERIAHQSATIDVLQAMSASPGDPQPVFDLIVQHAHELCDSPNLALTEYDGELVYLRSMISSEGDPTQMERWRRGFPRAPSPGPSGSVYRDGRDVHIRDNRVEPGADPISSAANMGSTVGLPVLHDGKVVGAIFLAKIERGGYSDSQVALLKTFAEQAAIAIRSAETYRKLSLRTADLQEALEQETATAEVLQVINASPGDLAPVFSKMLEEATRLCEAAFGELWSEDQPGSPVSLLSVPPAYAEFRARVKTTPGPGTFGALIRAGERVIHAVDLAESEAYRNGDPGRRAMVDLGGARSAVAVALRKDDVPRGMIVIYRKEVIPFTDRQIALLQNFAAQAVIAMENARLLTEQREALEQQTATAEVLRVINASPGDLVPVFQAIVEKAHSLCGAAYGSLQLWDGEKFRGVAMRGFSEAMVEQLRLGYSPWPNMPCRRIVEGEHVVHCADLAEIDDPTARTGVRLGGVRTIVYVALRKDDVLLGQIVAARQEVRPFSAKEIALVESFAAHAVIAMENARLINEQREALEQQTATAEVLQVINASPGNLTPVFDAMLEKAIRLCESSFGILAAYDGEYFQTVAMRDVAPGLADAIREPVRPSPGMAYASIVNGEDVVHLADITTGEAYRSGNPIRRALADKGGARTALFVALRKDQTLLGLFMIYRQEVRPFSQRQIALLRNFAAQAVIAIENARLLNELRASTDELAQRQAELRITFENMGDGVVLFDETPRLVAWNRKFQELLELPDAVLDERLTFAEYIRYLAERGDFGGKGDLEAQVRRLMGQAAQARVFERTRPDGRVVEIRHNPVPSGGFVLIYADITERKRNEAAIRAARDAAEAASRTIEAAYRDLKAAQANLIQAEKMASLGQLTAGIAHEIKNPLNFVNNFSALSSELIDELRELLAPQSLDDTVRIEVDDLTTLLKGNLEKVVQHGKRADGIVKSMLEHSRGASGERRTVDLNTLVEEALNLAYHGARAQDQSFNITLERDYGEAIAPILVNPQDMTRVFLNLFGNGFYAASKRAQTAGQSGFQPTLKVRTRDLGAQVEIRVRDNGTGIPADIQDKLFQPFFTTKPPGEGTGLGLSITYDIVTQQHGGTITLDSEIDSFTEFVVTLPRTMFTSEGSRA